MRIAEANGYTHFRWLEKMQKQVCGGLPINGVAAMEVLAAMVGRPSGDVDRLGGIEVTSDRYRLTRSQEVQAVSLNQRSPKVCPECLAERRMLPATWDLALWVGCPVHGRELVADCAGCGEPLSWSSGQVDRCCEGFPLADRRGPVLGAQSLDFMRALAAKVGVDAPPPSAGPAALTSGMSADQLSRLARHLGAMAEWGTEVPRHETARRLGMKAAVAIVESTADVLCGWPQSFHLFVDRLAAGDAKEDVRFRGSLGWLFRSITTTLHDDAYRPLHREMDLHAREAFGLWSSALARCDPQQEEMVGHHAAASELRVNPRVLAEWLATGSAAGERLRDGARVRWLVRRSEVSRLAAELGAHRNWYGLRPGHGLFTLKEAAAMLGLDSSTVGLLVASGLLQPGHPQGQKPNNRNATFMPASAVRDLLRHFEDLAANACAATLPGFSNASHPALRTARDLGRITDWKMPEVLAFLVNSGLAPAAIDPSSTGLARFLFDREGYKEALAAEAGMASFMTMAAAANALRTSDRVVKRLVARNVLQARLVRVRAEPVIWIDASGLVPSGYCGRHRATAAQAWHTALRPDRSPRRARCGLHGRRLPEAPRCRAAPTASKAVIRHRLPHGPIGAIPPETCFRAVKRPMVRARRAVRASAR